MPANLPPQYYEAEKKFRLAKDTMDKVAILEEMLAIMPKHKGTDHLKAELRQRIAKLSRSVDKKSATQHASMRIQKEGAAQVVVVGLPNTGKSQLISNLTSATPTVAEYPFTTTSATPGMMEFENIKIQLIDTPPLAPQTIEPWFRHLLIRCDAILIIIDLSNAPLAGLEGAIARLSDMGIQSGQKKTLIIGNKLDLEGANESLISLREKCKEQFPVIAISAKVGTGLEALKREIYQLLDIIRVYTKAPGQKPDYDDPIILTRGSTLEDAAAGIRKDFRTRMKYARVWGSGKHDGIMASRTHILLDGDVIELHL